MSTVLSSLQRVGRALMLPIAVLPVAALLLRLGQPDLMNLAAIAAAGSAIFSNLGLLFAIGVAVGLARENHGAAGLASVVGYLVATKGAEVLIPVPAEALAHFNGAAVALAEAAYRAKELGKLSVPVGILSGLIAGGLYNRYSDIRLPAYLAFFGGRRFVPIASGFAGLVLAVCFGYGWPVLEHGMDALSQAVLGSKWIGLFAYGVLNRALIITGLHHILNNIAWFLLGDYNGVTGDLNRFFAGDPSAGAFMSGFFPVMMFGLPAACLAMYRSARTEKKKAVGGLLLSMALTSFLTGVTEPIEFTFMFLAPVLYAIHALLTGAAMVMMNLFSVKLGFGFSAGLFDYVLNYSRSTRPLWLIPIGAIYFALYYGLFSFVIKRFDLKTPGRETEEVSAPSEAAESSAAQSWIRALGGAANLTRIDACTTRLRLNVADQTLINDSELKRLGARGVVRPSADTLQVVVGPVADQLASDIRQATRGTPVQHLDKVDVAALARALGGSSNIESVAVHATRLGVHVRESRAIDIAGIKTAGARAAVKVTDSLWHVIVGPSANEVASHLRASVQ
jgi:PTS system N-acetylglucosamine-specific IIC component